ncbi:stress protein [Reichenbachiella versicolor]|uniref:stress protein n=1 Tax=Reichenbachiella versicolor TaxID=1821036 RepID=UPI000D6E8671|nr:stress protein [Reichenbachiella versicolor]
MYKPFWISTLLLLLVGVTQAQPKHTYDHPKYDINEVSRVSTSQNTVTCIIYEIDSKHFAYSAGDGNKIDVFSVGEKAKMKPLASYVVTGGKKTIRGLVADTIDGQDYLFAGLKGGNAIEVFKINNDGTLKSVFVIEDTPETYLGTIITLQVIHMKEASYLFAGGLERPTRGMSSFKIGKDGSLTHVKSIADNQEIFTDGIIGMSIHRIDGRTILMTGGFHDNGLSSWEVFEDGTFKNISNIADSDTRFLNGTYPVISSSIQGWNFVVVGHRHHSYYKPTPWVKDRKSYYYHGDAVSVFMLNKEGELIPRSVFIDDNETMIQAQTRLHRLPIDEYYDLIAVATRDNRSIQLFALTQQGRLYDAGKIKTGLPVYYGLAGQVINDQLYLFIGSVAGSEFVSYRLDRIKEKD